jgi:uncharacterized protein (DUF58 family)
MVTARARWIILIAMTGTIAGLVFDLRGTTRVCLALLLWMLVQWLLFRWRSDVLAYRLTGQRHLSDESGPMRTLWIGRTYQVRVHIRLTGWFGIPYLHLQERLPQALEAVTGTPEIEGGLGFERELSFDYSIHPTTAGTIRFEGVKVRLADLQGFFYAERFIPIPQTVQVFPALVEFGSSQPYVKRHNLMPPPGRHRHPRPGIGSELLEIRDYVPGDPPRSIAWKVSARRDRLMSKELESEVPVRCTLFIDGSNSVRVGYPRPTPLAHLMSLAAIITQSALANRDPVGMCLFDERDSQWLPLSAHPRQVFRIMNHLAGTIAQPPDPVPCPVAPLIQQGHALCREVYPNLLRKHINRVPFRIFPLPGFGRGQRRQRVQLATILTERYDLPPGAPVRLIYDDRYCATWLQRFLGDHQVAYDGPLYDEQGRYYFHAPEKIPVLVRNLSRAIGKGHDNELFVLMADLLELEEELEPLLKIIQVAMARHHRVMVLCAWPPGLELPRRVPVAPESGDPGQLDSARNVIDLVRQADRQRYHAAFRYLRHTLARLRVPVVCAAETLSAHYVLAQLEIMRTGRRWR